MMSDFWKTVLSSVGFSVAACAFLGWLCREWISARLHKSIQHEYDKKLADYETKVKYEYDVQLEGFKSRIHYEYDLKLEEIKSKTQYEYELKLESSKIDFQNLLNERQTRFKYWYDEKAKAIKDLFCSITDLNYYLHEAEFLFLELKTKGATDDIKKYLDNKHLDFSSQFVDCFIKWQKLTLFLEDKEYDEIKGYFDACSDLNRRYEQYTEDNNLVSYIKDISINLGKMNDVISNLRKSFQESLKNEASVFQKQDDGVQKELIDQNGQSEKKPPTE